MLKQSLNRALDSHFLSYFMSYKYVLLHLDTCIYFQTINIFRIYIAYSYYAETVNTQCFDRKPNGAESKYRTLDLRADVQFVCSLIESVGLIISETMPMTN